MCEYAKILFHKKRRNKEDLIKAAEYYKMSADLGNPEAMYAYGNMLYNGICIPCNKKESLEYLKKSAELKHPYGMLTYAQILRETRDINNIKEALKYYKVLIDQNEKNAMFDYAIMLLDGIGVSVNKEEAIKYIKKSADLGNSEAMAYYGNFRFYGIETKANKDESIQYLKKSVEKENLRGMLEYAVILLKSHVVENIKEAVKYFKQIINKGNLIMMNEIEVQFFGMNDKYVYAKAMSIYGNMLYYGIGVQVDKNESLKLLKKSVELNDPNGKLMYAKILLKDDDVKSKLEASNYFKELISDGDAEAMYEYGMMLIEGNGIPMNKKEAIKYIIKASELNCSEAIIRYGMMLIDGKEVPANIEKAIKCFEKAADLGNVYGMLSYGIIILLLKSKYIKSYKKAAELFKKCIDIFSGNYFIKTEEHIMISSVAMLYYGNMLLKGLGIPKNIKEAVNYIKQSANLGNADAMAVYGEMLYYGNGVEIDRNEAMKYLKKSIELKENGYGVLVLHRIQNNDTSLNEEEEDICELKILANSGDYDAMFKYSIYLYFKNLITESIECIMECINHGHKESMKFYSVMFLGKGRIKENPIEAEHYLKKAAYLGDSQAWLILGFHKYNYEKNKEEGIKCIIIAAESGHLIAKIWLGLYVLFENGFLKSEY